MNLVDLRFTECAYFYKLKDGMTISEVDVRKMMREVTTGKPQHYLFDLCRVNDGKGTRFSLRVFKSRKDKPTFFERPKTGWGEQRIGYYLFVECGSYVAIMKRYATIPKVIAEKLNGIDYSTLMALETKTSSVFKKLSIQNLDGSDYAMRNKTYESLNLSKNISAIGVSRYYVRSVKGVNGNKQFALTLNASRVNEFESGLTISDVCGWVRKKVDEIGALTGTPDTLLSAFAQPVSYSTTYTKLQPRSLLVFYGLIESLIENDNVEFHKKAAVGASSVIDKKVVERYLNLISRAFVNVHDVGGKYYVGKNDEIEILVQKSGIRLVNKTWQNITINGSEDGQYDSDLQSLINANHQFNVYFTVPDIVYSNRTLFKDARLLTSIPQFIKLLNGKSQLDGLSFEKHKGRSPVGLSDWVSKSVFKIVEQVFMPQYDYFICDDCNDEWADHIGIATDKVSFFVSKHKTSHDSASDFQDVVGQALKNLGNMTPSRAQLNEKAIEWAKKNQTSNINRFRSSKGTVKDAVDLWNNNLMSPNYEREMCLVVDFMEKSVFERQLKDISNKVPVKNESELFQRLWILSSFVNSCLEYGVKPVIYCKN